MIAQEAHHQRDAASQVCLPARVDVVWDVAAEGLRGLSEAMRRTLFGERACRGMVRVVAAIEIGDPSRVRVWLEGEAGSKCEVATAARCEVVRDGALGLVHVDGGESGARVLITLRVARDGVTVVYARSEAFEGLGVAGGRVESPGLRVME